MNTPPLLLGATLLFWGWQTGFMLPAAAMALVLEGAGLIKARWEFSDDDLSRIWTFCAVLFLAALVYAFSANDGVGNLTGLFQDANLRTQRRAVETGGRTAVAMIRWLPMTLFLFVAAQTYNTRDTVPLATISLILRRRLRRARARGEASPETPAIAVAFPYFAVCLLAACATTERDRTFLPGFCVMVFWALWPYRSRRFGYTAWAGSLVAALVLGFAGQRGIIRLQQFVNSYNPDWFSGLSQRGFDPQQSRTSLGHIGEMKTSGRIVLRLKTPKGQSPPELLREASYRRAERTGPPSTSPALCRVRRPCSRCPPAVPVWRDCRTTCS